MANKAKPEPRAIMFCYSCRCFRLMTAARVCPACGVHRETPKERLASLETRLAAAEATIAKLVQCT